MTVTEIDQSMVPGGMERRIRRRVSNGVIEFEEAPVGYLTQKGTPRLADWRAYHWAPVDGNRVRLPSVTTILDTICPKDGLPPWAEARGIEGAVAAIRMGEIDIHQDPPERAVEIVRTLKLGAEGSRDQAAQRGLNVHGLLEEYMKTGAAPGLAGHPVEHHGYIQGLTKFLLDVDAEPEAVEQLVVDPEEGYAGRLDLRARARKICSGLITFDAKTQEKAGIYRGAHLQVNLYERAAVKCGDEPAERLMVVVFAVNGEYRMMPADHEKWRVDAALLFARAMKPIDSVCESLNRAERKARAT